MINKHNEIRDATAEVLKEICINVVVKVSQKTSNRADISRSDVSAKNLWIKEQITYCYVRVFNPVAKCHLIQSIGAIH